MFVDKGHYRNYLNSIIRERKHQAPKTENTDKKHRQITIETNYRTQNKKRTSKDMI